MIRVEHEKWGTIAYGDTDSMFVHVPQLSLRQSFSLAKVIVQSISNMYSEPIKLKFEKTYQPCFLLAKKRYVGRAFECAEESVFDAKGIETVRRDGCILGQKIIKALLE